MREFLRRGGWVFLAVLFIVTALGVGVYAFLQNTHTTPESGYIKCPTKKISEQKPGKDSKYQGAKLVDFKPVKHVSYLQCWDTKVGNGAIATATSSITAVYTGALYSKVRWILVSRLQSSLTKSSRAGRPAFRA
jgi:hypothetical protein